MNRGGDRDTQNLLKHVLVLVANEDDARRTARALGGYEPTPITALHDIKEGSVPDQPPVEDSKTLTVESVDVVRVKSPTTDEQPAYSHDNVAANTERAEESETSAIDHRSRGGGQLTHSPFGGFSLNSVVQPDRLGIAPPWRDTTG